MAVAHRDGGPASPEAHIPPSEILPSGWAGAWDATARLGFATIVGLALGIERELRRKPAGMRTHALVSIGAALVTLSSVRIAAQGDEVDPEAISRAVQGIIAGVGFLGGGVILKAGDHSRVRNLTTAASLWVAAGLGIVCGAGQWSLAVAALALTLLVLNVVGLMERRLHQRRRAETARRRGGRSAAVQDDDGTLPPGVAPGQRR